MDLLINQARNILGASINMKLLKCTFKLDLTYLQEYISNGLYLL